MDDLESALPAFYSECRTFHDINSSPVSISDGILVMSGDLSLLLPNSSDFYVNENSVLMSTFVKLTEFIPAAGWELLQDSPGDQLIDIARELLSNHLDPESAEELDELILSMENVLEVLEEAVWSIDKYPVSSCQLPTLFRSVTGTLVLLLLKHASNDTVSILASSVLRFVYRILYRLNAIIYYSLLKLLRAIT